MIERFRTPGFSRVLVWASVLVLVAGVVAIVVVRWGAGESSPQVSQAGQTTVDGSNYVDPTQTTPKESDVPVAARRAAGEFVLAAVGREDLAKAWKLSDPELKQTCACTYKQWLTGNIPVQFFPTTGLKGAAFAVNEVSPGRVVLIVRLTPGKNGDGLAPTSFYIGLRQRGGTKAPWLVDYWAPVNVVAVPADPVG